MKVGVLGGTFDPVHCGHLILAEQARTALALDLVLFIPAGEPWRKSDRPITSGSQRLDMLRLAIDGNDAFGLSDIELRRPGPTYTADTLETLAAERLDDEFWFIIGADALADMPNWHDPERIIRHARLAVAPRTRGAPQTPVTPAGAQSRSRPGAPPPADPVSAEQAHLPAPPPTAPDAAFPSDQMPPRPPTPSPADSLSIRVGAQQAQAAITAAMRRLQAPAFAGRIEHFTMPEIDISSTDIRARVAANRSIRYLVPDPVRTYIASHHLYRR